MSEIIAKGGKAIAVQANVAKEADVVRLFAETKKAFERLDILVNNAGVYEIALLENVTAEQFHKMFDLNVLGLLLASREAVKLFPAEGGSIINIGSVAGTSAPATTTVYSATKGAVDTVTKALAKELGPRKIRVNSINPGMVETEGVHAAGIAESDWRTDRGADAAGQDRAAARYRAGGRVPGIGRFRLDHRRVVLYLGGASIKLVAPVHARIGLMTLPATSVNRKRRPLYV